MHHLYIVPVALMFLVRWQEGHLFCEECAPRIPKAHFWDI